MSININRDILDEILSDKAYRDELCEFLNQVIDEEILKGDDMNDTLISECVEALLSLENGSIDEAVDTLRGSNNIVRFCHRKNFERKNMNRRIAAAIALILLTTGVTLRTNPALAEKAKDIFNQIVSTIIASNEETDEDSDVTQIYLTYDALPEITSEDVSELDLSGITVHAVHRDGSESTVPHSECTVTVTKLADGAENAYLLNFSYQGCSGSIICYTEESK